VPAAGIIRFGSLTARLTSESPGRAEDVARIFGTSLKPASPELASRAELAVALREPDRAAWPDRPAIPPDGMVLRHSARRPEIHTEHIAAALDLGTAPAHADVALLTPHPAHFDLCVHLAVVFHKLLFLMDRVVLHAAAVRLGGRVSMFLGDRGAGKSTISLRLARAGGAVLGEDHLILRRDGAGFAVSGCDERSRLDAKTERHFFDRPLAAEPADFAGRLKKEMPAHQLFRSEPYTDRLPALLFFARPGGRFAIAPLSRRVALLKLMEAAGKLQRFVDPMDRGRFLALLSDFVATVEPYDLSLSEDIQELDRLAAFLTPLETAAAP
jgi:hypothetical protein